MVAAEINAWRRNVFIYALAALAPLTLLLYFGTALTVRLIDDLLVCLSKTEFFSDISAELLLFGEIFSALDHAEIIPFLPIDISLASLSAFLPAVPAALNSGKHKFAAIFLSVILFFVIIAVSLAVSVWFCEVNGIRFCTVMRSLYRNIGYI